MSENEVKMGGQIGKLEEQDKGAMRKFDQIEKQQLSASEKLLKLGKADEEITK